MRIIYWTTACIEPKIEAISKEVFSLSKHFKSSFVFSVNPHIIFKFSYRNRYIGFNPIWYPFLRILIPVVEFFCDINHVYGDIAPWIYYKSLKRKPIVHTIASEKGELNAEFFERCSFIICQTTSMKSKLDKMVGKHEKVKLIYPGIDLVKFQYDIKAPDPNPPRILFATAPRTSEELEKRGVFRLLKAAQIDPHIQFTLLFRRWTHSYTSFAVVQDYIEKNKIKNIRLRNEIVGNMSEIYKNHHFTLIPFTEGDGGKECPDSALESIACGRPVLISDVSDFSSFIRRNKCGVIYDTSSEDMVKKIYEGISDYDILQKKMENIAIEFFDLEKILSSYEMLYEKCFGE